MTINSFMGFPFRTASPVEFEEAKQLGKRIEGRDGDAIVIAYEWRGALWIADESGVNGECAKEI